MANTQDLPNLDAQIDQQIAAQQGGVAPVVLPPPAIVSGENGQISMSEEELNKIAENDLSGLPNMDAIIDGKINNPAQKQTLPDPTIAGPQFITDTFNHVGKLFGEGFKMPDGVTAENFTEKLLETMAPLYQKNISPEALELNEILANNGTVDDYIGRVNQEKGYQGMTPDDALYNYYKDQHGKTDDNPDGLEEAELKDYISKMDPVKRKIEGLEIKKALINAQNERMEQKNNELAGQREIQRKEQINAVKIDMEKKANETIAQVGNITDIFGIPVSKGELDAFNNEFKQLILPDEKGISPATKLLYNDKVLYKLLYIANKSGAVKDLIQEAKNQDIRELKNSLQIEPVVHSGNATSQLQGGIDYDKLSAPARN